MKKGPFTPTELDTIKTMLEGGYPKVEIGKKLKRSVYMINKAIEENGLDKETVEQIIEDVSKPQTEESVIKKARGNLLSAGVSDVDIEVLLRKALSKDAYDNPEELYYACINQMGAGHFIQKRTTGGKRGGVAIMTEAASSRSDESKKRNRGKSTRSTRGHIYEISSGKIV